MNDFNGRYQPIPSQADMAVDAGLRAFMLGVYNKLAIGLAVAGGLAWASGNYEPLTQLLYVTQNGSFAGYTPAGMVVAWAPLVLLFGSMFLMRNPTSQSANLLYWVVVASIGLSLGLWFLVYTDASIASTFFVTAAAFGALSLWGYTTKRNMSGWGSFLFMGVIGLIIASLVNIWLQSPALYWVVNSVGVLLFSALIAYDTQRLKMTYYAVGGDQAALGTLTSFGALSLFINFINLFQFLLSFLGSRE